MSHKACTAVILCDESQHVKEDFHPEMNLLNILFQWWEVSNHPLSFPHGRDDCRSTEWSSNIFTASFSSKWTGWGGWQRLGARPHQSWRTETIKGFAPIYCHIAQAWQIYPLLTTKRKRDCLPQHPPALFFISDFSSCLNGILKGPGRLLALFWGRRTLSFEYDISMQRLTRGLTDTWVRLQMTRVTSYPILSLVHTGEHPWKGKIC